VELPGSMAVAQESRMEAEMEQDGTPVGSSQSDTSATLTDRGRGTAERVALGKNPSGSIVRIIVAVVVFIVVAGTVFYLAMN
jgi:hypothetical protein